MRGAQGLVVSLAAALSFSALPAEAYSNPLVTIKSCYDGDTCTTSAGEKIRLACIDTPELRGRRATDPEAARAARDHLNGLVKGKRVWIKRHTKDRYGRTVGELFVWFKNINKEMVDSGHAEIYRRYAKQCRWARSN